ncbi:winged helix-turn-helix domain-containing protein [Terrimonas sp. NA20]|uniref:Winged helix-turn-helix domain-containing protein n=1 Tax=Terrimonas ginsenosidimutans TaxID=2908004 RepID=A0ABS9KSE2_9BACT|nr:helix-turn-helix domain-containing protein [Terrimonas ginsenosidimutans]MCG2615195.1 winged helix-turn-helix domain-containing protein [Terrimonas ginsenosidimutans]
MKQYSLFAALSVSMIVFVMAFVKKENEHPDKHLEVVLRTIGHEVLLHSKDSTSRVLPVKTVNENTFRISFEHSFGFTPDTLMKVVHQQLAKTDRLDNYTVSVNECDQNQTVFSYEVNTASGDLRPCRGRKLKTGCYVIDISFPAKRSFNYAWLLLALIPVAFAALYFARRGSRLSAARELIEKKDDASQPGNIEPDPVDADHQKIGNFLFFESKGMLSLSGETIELSIKEAKALSILALNRNQVVGRDLLMKEIWEDDGIFVVTRNVDVLISKLRKRLSADPSVKIVNVHGKGYRMIA